VVDVEYNTAYHVSSRQTPPESKEGETRVNDYVRHFKEDCHLLPKSVRYVAVDGYYSKQSFTHAILEKGYHQIGLYAVTRTYVICTQANKSHAAGVKPTMEK
jgi:hypothetical protein